MRRSLFSVLLLGLLALAPAVSHALGEVAPNFTLRDINNQNVNLADFKGKVVLLNFWATWCAPCREEMPHLNRLYEKYRAAGFVLLGVNVDDDPANVLGVAGTFGVKFPMLLDTDKQVSKLYDLATMPSTVLIDRDGKVRYLHRGYKPGTELEYDQQIRTLLK